MADVIPLVSADNYTKRRQEITSTSLTDTAKHRNRSNEDFRNRFGMTEKNMVRLIYGQSTAMYSRPLTTPVRTPPVTSFTGQPLQSPRPAAGPLQSPRPTAGQLQPATLGSWSAPLRHVRPAGQPQTATTGSWSHHPATLGSWSATVLHVRCSAPSRHTRQLASASLPLSAAGQLQSTS